MTWKVLAAAPLPGRISLVVEVITTLAWRLGKLPTALAHRNELRRLAECDEHVLADVGVTREELTKALSAPFWRNPSEQLARVSELTNGRCRTVDEIASKTGQPVVTSPELILAACNRRRLPVTPLYLASR
jgi:Domain of unknown function (DUF1127)